VVTGGASGLGLAVAERLVELGARVVVAAAGADEEEARRCERLAALSEAEFGSRGRTPHAADWY
jgi:NAD(P)-dependent dehydrogenase (short-subunit alcohol dehydrogenase family)